MTLGRIVRFIALFVIVLSAWCYMNHVGRAVSSVRDDLPGRTRFLIRQAQIGDATTLARLAARYRCPADDVPPLPIEFDRLWPVLRDGDPSTVAPNDADSPEIAPTPSRQVRFQGRDDRRRPATVQLDWVQVRGAWHIEGWKVTTKE